MYPQRIKSRKSGRALRRCGLVLALTASTAWAGAFPDKPLRIIQGGPPGGGLDIYARIVADAIAPMMGQPIVVETKPGGSGTLAANTLLSAPNDGYTVMMNMDGLVTELPHSMKLNFDPFKDLRPLAEIYNTGLFLVAHPDVPADTVDELVGLIKSKPEGSFSYASYSAGTLSHGLGLMLGKAAGIEMNHVPYKGTPPALVDIVGGHIPIGFVGSLPLPPLVKDGRIKLIAFSGPTRSVLFPDIPTFAEAGYPDVVATVGIAMYTTSDIPAEAREKWRESVSAALRQDEIVKRFADLGQVPSPERSPDEIAAVWKASYDRLGELFGPIGQP